MNFVCAFVIATVFGAAQSTFDVLDVPFSPELTKEILKTRFSVFSAALDAAPSVYRKTTATIEMDTPAGTAQGIITETCRKKTPYAAFFGMPYARPPVRDLRFKEPVPMPPWAGVYDATFERPSCLQYEGQSNIESEDCLYINVFTPNFNYDYAPLPVMVFIHGGAFVAGSSNTSIYAPDFLVENNVVLVTFNYRLGILGFLSMQNDEVPGNMGLKDQNLALKWVQTNIASFGGNPQAVTIFGESAGSASVHYHILSDSSKGLFQRAIMESGTATAPWAYTPAPVIKRLGVNLARKLGCGGFNEYELVNCLRRVPGSKLTEEQMSTLSMQDVLSTRPFAFVPTDEPNLPGAFISESPLQLMLSNDFNPVPTIIGSNSREALIVLPVLQKVDPFGFAMLLIGLDLSVFFPYQLREKMNVFQRMKVSGQIRQFYFGTSAVSIFTRDKLINLITDTAFTMPIQQTAAIFANTSEPVYNYVFSYSGEYGFYKKKLSLTKEPGVCHGDELGYIFYVQEVHPQYERNVTEFMEEEKMVEDLTAMWANFARTGDPTPDSSAATKWYRRTLHDLIYLDIGKEMVLMRGMGKELRRRIDFWYFLIQDILH